MRDDADAIDAEKGTAAVLFIIRLVLNRSNGIPRKESADFSHPCTHELVLEPLKHRHRDRFARFQDNVANESVAYDNFNRIFKEMTAFYVANEVKRTWSQHLEYFLGQFGALNILVAERDQADGRILGMHNLDTRIVALVFAQLVFDLGGVSHQIELLDLVVIAQRHDGAGNKVRRTKVTAHRVEGDLHQCETLRTLASECKMKIVPLRCAKR